MAKYLIYLTIYLSVHASLLSTASINKRRSRSKRSFFQFGDMLKAAGFNFVDYMRYGNWCGSGGGGGCVDQTDQCCFVHDYCYGYFSKEYFCAMDGTYYPYQFKVLDALESIDDPERPFQVQCSSMLSKNQWFKIPLLSDYEDYCSRSFCECDMAAINCFLKHKDSYDRAHYTHPYKHLEDFSYFYPEIDRSIKQVCNVTDDSTPALPVMAGIDDYVEDGKEPKQLSREEFCSFIKQNDKQNYAIHNC